MRRGGWLPNDRAEVGSLMSSSNNSKRCLEAERIAVLAEIELLCDAPAGKHPLRTPLAGWNTLDVLAGERRVAYKAAGLDGWDYRPRPPASVRLRRQDSTCAASLRRVCLVRSPSPVEPPRSKKMANLAQHLCYNVKVPQSGSVALSTEFA